MAVVSVNIKKNYTDAKMAKQLPFALAKGLTDTAKDAQKDILGNLSDVFTLRGNWFNPSNKFGIKIQPATKTNPIAKVGMIVLPKCLATNKRKLCSKSSLFFSSLIFVGD